MSYANQAAWLTQAYAIARKNPRIDMMLWFLIRDDASLGGWQSGLETVSGKKKPAWNAFVKVATRLEPPFGQERAVERVDVVDEALHRVALHDARATGLAHPGALLRMGGELGERRRERIRVVRVDEEAVHAVADDVRDAADARGDDRRASGERLHDAHRACPR